MTALAGEEEDAGIAVGGGGDRAVGQGGTLSTRGRGSTGASRPGHGLGPPAGSADGPRPSGAQAVPDPVRGQAEVGAVNSASMEILTSSEHRERNSKRLNSSHVAI